MQIALLNRKTVMIPEPFAERAKEMLADFLQNSAPAPDSAASDYSLRDKLRMITEGLLFGWVMPGKKWPSKKQIRS